MTVVKMDSDGRVTVPDEALRALGLEGDTAVEVEADVEQGTIVLRPTHDDWLYSEENEALIDRGLADVRAGRVRHAGPDEFRELAEIDQ